MPLEVRDFGAREENILPCACRGLIFLNLQLHDVRRVLNDFVDVGPVPRAHFAEDTLEDPDDAADEPVTLYTHTGW